MESKFKFVSPKAPPQPTAQELAAWFGISENQLLQKVQKQLREEVKHYEKAQA